jgi:hypothetical protein
MDPNDYLRAVRGEFVRYRRLAEKAMAQTAAQDFFVTLDPESNSLAVLVKHVGGNLRSRWRDFLTADGEKADRDRDSEFVITDGDTRESLMERWDAGWQTLFDTLDSLAVADLDRSVRIRAEPHSVPLAMERGLAHIACHCGQIVFLAKHLASAHWQTLSVPRGASKELNARMMSK